MQIENEVTLSHKMNTLVKAILLSTAALIMLSTTYFILNNDKSNEISSLEGVSNFKLVQAPLKETYDRYALFVFDKSGAIECSLNDASYEECESRFFIPEVPEGKNSLSVRDVESKQILTSYEWQVLDIFEKETDDLLISNQTPSKAEPRSWRGIIRINCDFSHSSYNDPIIFPGEENAAHLHRFYGNELVDHTTTLESLLTTGSSTCQGDALNRSAYWVPALLAPAYSADTGEREIDANGEPAWRVVPAVVGNNEEAHEVFYYSAGVDDLESIQPIPVGLRMIAGEQATKLGKSQDTSIVRWHCQSWESSEAGNPRWSTTIPECKAPDRVRMDIFFPSCWNGRDLDSSDHKSHMAYPVKNDSGEMVCPSSHHVPIVRPSYHYAFGVLPNVYDPETKSSQGWRLASDDYEVTNTTPGGITLHGDWWNGWHPTIMEAMLETCIQDRYDCHNGNLANGWRLVDTHKGVGTEPPITNSGRGLMDMGSHSESSNDSETPEVNSRQRPQKERPSL